VPHGNFFKLFFALAKQQAFSAPCSRGAYMEGSGRRQAARPRVLVYHVALSLLFRAARAGARPLRSMSLKPVSTDLSAQALPSRRLSVAPMMDWTEE